METFSLLVQRLFASPLTKRPEIPPQPGVSAQAFRIYSDDAMSGKDGKSKGSGKQSGGLGGKRSRDEAEGVSSSSSSSSSSAAAAATVSRKSAVALPGKGAGVNTGMARLILI
jgi:hypothetical protein